MRPWRGTICALLGLSACTKSGGPVEFFAPAPPPEVAYVSPDGGDRADGTKSAPFASLRRALRTDRPRIVLLAGVFPEPEVNVTRSVVIEGTHDGRAVLDGHLFVSAPDVTVRNFDVTEGVSTHLSGRLRVESATISAGAKDDALSVVSSRADLSDLVLSCGPETCLQATTATVSAQRMRAAPTERSKRIVRIETSSATLSQLHLRGGGISQLQVGIGARVRIETSTLSDAEGNGLAAVRGAHLFGRDVRVRGARKLSLLAQRSVVELTDCELGGTADITVGVAGGRLTVDSSTVSASPQGALSLSANSGDPAQVELRGGVVRHLDRDGALVGEGTLVVDGTRFVGDGRPGDGPGDAIVANGVGAVVDIRSARIESPRGFGVVIAADAAGTVTATITNPGRGGVLVEGVAVETVRLVGTVVTGCREGSGLVALGSPSVEVEGGAARGCAEAGYLAGERSHLQISGASAIDNREYGFAAFGGSTVALDRSHASGSRWATFATCGDGARIELGQDVELDGQVVTCP